MSQNTSEEHVPAMTTMRRMFPAVRHHGRQAVWIIITLGSLSWSTQAACSLLEKPSDASIAEHFIAGVNARNIDQVVGTSKTPFVFQNQAWESAKDGSGFALGRVDERHANDIGSLRALISDVIGTIRIEQPKPVNKPPNKETLLKDYLSQSSEWKPLQIFVFLRGMGDVEHIALVGVDPNSHRVVAFYVN